MYQLPLQSTCCNIQLLLNLMYVTNIYINTITIIYNKTIVIRYNIAVTIQLWRRLVQLEEIYTKIYIYIYVLCVYTMHTCIHT